jgi:hypothetical protein
MYKINKKNALSLENKISNIIEPAVNWMNMPRWRVDQSEI